MFHWPSLSRPFLHMDGSPCCCTSPVFLSYCSLFENLKYQQYSVPIVLSLNSKSVSRFEQEPWLIRRFQNLGVHFVIPSCMKVGMPFCINAGLALWCLELVTERSVPCHFASMQDQHYGVWNRLQKEVFHVILHQCKTCTLELLLDFLIVKTYLFASLDYLLYNSWDDILYVGHCTLNRSKSHHRI